jgi:hypothetical protein
MVKKVDIVKHKYDGKIAVRYGQKKIIKLRAEVNRLYFEQGISKNAFFRKPLAKSPPPL